MLLIAATLFLLVEHVAGGESRCFVNGDCFELIAWTPPCSPVSKEGTGEIQFRLEHEAGVIREYCVIPIVDWGGTTVRYEEKCDLATYKNNTVKVKYEYTQAGTYTTKATINVAMMNVFWPPDQLHFTSEKVAITIGTEFCNQLATVPPTQSPTVATPSPTTETPRPTPPPTGAPVVTEPPVGPIWNVAPPPTPETFAPTKAPTTPSPTLSPTTIEQGASSNRTVPVARSGVNDERRWTGTLLLGQLFTTVCYFYHYWL